MARTAAAARGDFTTAVDAALCVVCSVRMQTPQWKGSCA